MPIEKHGSVSVYSPDGGTAAAAVKRDAAHDEDQAGKPTMMAADPEALYQAGLVFLQRPNKINNALLAFEQAYRLRPTEPQFASYYGLCLALCGRQLSEAESLCAHAVENGFYRSDLYLNLGRVYLARKKKRDALAAWQKGLSIEHGNAEIERELSKLGSRRDPVFAFLDRGHVLNRLCGRVRAQLVRDGSRTRRAR
jgi:tetratricopeptide (TPR) repeat protein